MSDWTELDQARGEIIGRCNDYLEDYLESSRSDYDAGRLEGLKEALEIIDKVISLRNN